MSRSPAPGAGRPWPRWPPNSRFRGPRSPTPTTGPISCRPTFVTECSPPPSNSATPGPDPVARSLRTRKAGAVGLMITEPLNYSFSDPAALDFVAGLAESCEEAGQGLLLVAIGPNRSVERRFGRRAGGGGRRLRGVLRLRRRSLPSGGAAAAPAGRGRRPAQGRSRPSRVCIDDRDGDAPSRGTRCGTWPSGDRPADDAAGPRLAAGGRHGQAGGGRLRAVVKTPHSTCSASASTASTTR